ncbi:hypothetical protein HCH_01994 [Hahella chejuensis KCTC 2396]|uniref:Knr4/Smi1-like domain-containing protein n=1 Tax=Hahella chejuensis (strain KCTC 2396) TaxID=349521 RepID=Q2SKJ6_HAHCH|nr:hypothetical protein [Hahella chejuensis]ABC28828.1 hypothetical protein HCH_01994 [Hahella chejuensis KCTC 2396]
MSKPADFIQKWREQGHPFHPPATVDAVKHTFSHCGLHATQDILEFYLACDGMSDFGAGLIRFWPLAEIAARAPDRSKYGVLFADYLLESELYRLKPKDEYTTLVYRDYFGGSEPQLVSQSLGEFLQRVDTENL